uniref:Ubiquitin-like domain-containing protein n=1 Tax=Spongospora subterranea TaxID=70186 RepID=A0A0H5R4T4_9EUKA|eukprot:CRZ08901.1 hypothetical protein [Spongospora subterranea]
MGDNEDQKPDRVKEDNGGETEHLNLKVKSQDGTAVFFKVKKHTPFKKLMEAFCKRSGKDMANVKFLFDGQRIREDQTPAELDMVDEDEIDAMVAQIGGN